MIDWITSLLNSIMDLPSWGIALFYLLSGFLESVVQFWPGTTTLVFGGALHGMGFEHGWIAVLLMFFAGEMLGMLLVFEFGARGGMRVLEWKWIRRLYTQEIQDKTRHWLGKYGAGMLFIAKFTAGVNTMADLIGGMMHLNRRKAYPAMMAACAIHNIIYCLIGYVVGESWESAIITMDEYSKILLYVALAALGGYSIYKVIGYFMIRRRRKLNNESGDL